MKHVNRRTRGMHACVWQRCLFLLQAAKLESGDETSAETGLADMVALFDGMTEGMSPKFGYSVGDYHLEELAIETYTLNVDGTVTFAIYVPKQ